MKHMIKKTMLTGALSCFLLGTALADDATNQPAKPYWQDIQVVMETVPQLYLPDMKKVLSTHC